MDAPATVLHVSQRNRLLVKRAEWFGATGAARDSVDILVGSEVRSLVNSGAPAGVLPLASGRDLSTRIQS